MLALLLSLSLGSNGLRVDGLNTTAVFSQSPTHLSLASPSGAGDTLAGEFVAAPVDWSAIDDVFLEAAVEGVNPDAVFSIEFLALDGGFPVLINAYEGATDDIGATFALLRLRLRTAGTGDFSRLQAMQFTWDTEGQGEGALVIRSLVGSKGPIAPVIESASYSAGGFTMAWSGTGDLPVNVRRRASLDAGGWEEVQKEITSGTYTDPNPPPAKAFYRVVVP